MHSVAENMTALNLLPDIEFRRLERIARIRSSVLAGMDWEDLLQETVKRVLDGSRQRPIGVPIMAFMTQTIRSISSDRRKSAALHGDMVDLADVGSSVESSAPSPEKHVSAKLAVEKISHAFADDISVSQLIAGLMIGESGPETRLRTGLSSKEYDAARKRLSRGMARLNLSFGEI